MPVKRLVSLARKTCCLLFACFLIAAFGLFLRGHTLDRQSREFADQSAWVVLMSWNQQDLRDRGAARFLAADQDGEIDRMFGGWRKLGELQRYDGSTGRADVTTTAAGTLVTANYTGTAEFSRGNALIKIALIEEDGAWRVLGFGVYPGKTPQVSSH